jgi:PAS domain S-box-containing protein
VEYRIETRDGQLKHIREVGYARKDANGAVSRLFGTAQDITEYKRVEEARIEIARELQQMTEQKEDLLRLVVDSIPIMAWSVRSDGVVDFLNRRWLEYTGSTLEQHVAEPLGPIHPEDVPAVREKWVADMAAGNLNEVEMRLRRADGKFRWFLVRTVPLRDEHGNIVKWYGTSTDIEDRKQAENAQRNAAAQLAALTRRLVELQEFERKELARELHDRIGQNLTALGIDLSIVAATVAPEATDELRARLADSQTLIESTVAAIRDVTSELRPPMLDELGLVQALKWHARAVSARTGISISVHGTESTERPAPETEIALFRIAQEALNNIIKHARANRVEIAVERSGTEHVMSVQDNGVGFETAKERRSRHRGLGMVTMRERSQAVGGRFEVRSIPGSGTRLTVQVPAQ